MSWERDLLKPARLLTAAEFGGRSCPVPAATGVYAWYFAPPPGRVPVTGCRTRDNWTLLYVGISPKRPPANGRPPSRQTIRSRIRTHFRGNAFGSSLRLALGSLLADELDLELRRVGTTRLTFGGDGEGRLTAWMAEHARVTWTVTPEPWLLEKRLIEEVCLPLNLDQNGHSPFRGELSALCAAQRKRARQ